MLYEWEPGLFDSCSATVIAWTKRDRTRCKKRNQRCYSEAPPDQDVRSCLRRCVHVGLLMSRSICLEAIVRGLEGMTKANDAPLWAGVFVSPASIEAHHVHAVGRVGSYCVARRHNGVCVRIWVVL